MSSSFSSFSNPINGHGNYNLLTGKRSNPSNDERLSSRPPMVVLELEIGSSNLLHGELYKKELLF
jgi:hypothetical protein